MKSKQKYELRLAGPLSKKVKFTKTEDLKLKYLVEKFTTKDWKLIASHLPPRTARQCRERWTNYINPELTQKPWTKEEDKILIELHQEIGNHWKIMEEFLPQRSKNSIKIRWNFLNKLVKDDKIVDLIDNQNSVNLHLYNDSLINPSNSANNLTVSQPPPPQKNCEIQSVASYPAIIPVQPIIVSIEPLFLQVSNPIQTIANTQFIQTENVEPLQNTILYTYNPELTYTLPTESYFTNSF